MTVVEQIKKATKTLFSFEILPPLKGIDIQKVYKVLDPLMEFQPRYINITTHREDIVYNELPNGLVKPKVVRKRPGTVAIAAAIQHKYGIPVVPHILCGGFTKAETEYVLIDLNFLEIHNLLVVRGDPRRSEKFFKPVDDGHQYVSGVLEQINNLNKGKYLDEEIENSSPMNFSYGVGGFPEKHFESPNVETDMFYLKQKVDLGAKYIVTQMFFNNQKYYDFVKRCREAGINVPIVPGLKPLAFIKHLNVLPQLFNVDIPEELAKDVRDCKNNEEAYEVGIEWSISQAKDLMKNKVPVLHFYSMGSSKNIRKIAEAIF